MKTVVIWLLLIASCQAEIVGPMGSVSGSLRVLWVGSGDGNSDYCRSARRSSGASDDRDHSLGFRVLRSSIK